jgi:hypothetical protein
MGSSVVRRRFKHKGERIRAPVRDGVAAAAGIIGAIDGDR